MKKSIKIFTSVLTSALLAISSIPVFSFAEEHITGDVNGDGVVNAVDASSLIDSTDASSILAYYAEASSGSKKA